MGGSGLMKDYVWRRRRGRRKRCRWLRYDRGGTQAATTRSSSSSGGILLLFGFAFAGWSRSLWRGEWWWWGASSGRGVRLGLLWGAACQQQLGRGGGQQLPVVRLRGLPFDCAESDVLEFFAGLDVVDVLLAHKQGRFTGEAYCLLAAPMQVDLALHRHKQNMGRRYIEVFRSKKQEYYKAVAAEVADSKTSEKDRGDNNRGGERREERGNTNNNNTRKPPAPPAKVASEKDDAEHTGVLKLRGLPFSASASDVLEFFSGYDLSDENVHIVTRSGGRASGEAYVEFKSPEDSKAAMSKDNMMMGSRYIELFPSSREEALKVSSK